LLHDLSSLIDLQMVRKKIKINFTDWTGVENPIFQMLSRRFDLEFSDDPDFILYS